MMVAVAIVVARNSGGGEWGVTADRVESTRSNHGNYSSMFITRRQYLSTWRARLGAVRFRLGPLLPLAYFASPSVHETINRALHTVEVNANVEPIQRRDYTCKTPNRGRRVVVSETRILDSEKYPT